MPIGIDEHHAREATPTAPLNRGVVALCLASIRVMLPWPLLAMLITHSTFDNWN